jgi:hypothetical protein
MKLFNAKTPAMATRGIHFDMKGMPPTPDRLLQLLDLCAGLRINAVLMEWEDTFPWRTYPEMKSPTAYTPQFISAFLKRAKENGIEVIPLVQCLGHSEFVLRYKRFSHLRELKNDYSEHCPSNPESHKLVMELIDDVLDLSDGSIRRFHLGGDEAWRMGSCTKCKKAIRKDGKDQLYLGHVGPILNRLNYFGIRPILWDDMMRKWPTPALKEIGKRADLMAWSYTANPVDKWESLKEFHLAKYRKAGIRVWGASAYKGGDGAFDDLPNLETRMANNTAWARFARKYGMHGVVATAWGRYNTFMSPCETIEASLDSLVNTALILWNGRPPVEPGKAAQAFLRGFKNGRDWRIFDRCVKAAKDLKSWQTWDQRWNLELFERAAHLNGEPDRKNPSFVPGMVRNVANSIKKGKKLGEAFVKAHKGLVPDRWLRLYAESRVRPIERRFENVKRLSAVSGQRSARV